MSLKWQRPLAAQAQRAAQILTSQRSKRRSWSPAELFIFCIIFVNSNGMLVEIYVCMYSTSFMHLPNQVQMHRSSKIYIKKKVISQSLHSFTCID